MSIEQKPKVTPPRQSYRKMMIGLAALIVLMFALIGLIIVRVIGNNT